MKILLLSGTREYRVGLYNDGYLGSDNDLGTFQNREIEIKWLENQAMHTLYGGEVVLNSNTGTTLNTAAYMSKEAFRTHTTYLNSGWNGTVIDAWRNEIYNGDDELYVGQKGYTYIANHLGYRFVLRSSEITNKIKENDTLKLKLQIENVGFANLINEKVVTVLLEKDEKVYEIPTNIDATTWNSTEISNVNIEVQLPSNINLGEWNVYLRVSQYGDMTTDNNYNCIRLANNGIWKEKLGANYIGKITIEEAHYLELVPAKEATCSEPGNNEYYICSECQKVFLDELGTQETTISEQTLPIDEDAHNWDEWKVTTQPTADKEGIRTRICKNDNSHIETETISKLSSNNNNSDSPTSKANSSSPQTGDNVIVWIVILIISSIGLAFTFKK